MINLIKKYRYQALLFFIVFVLFLMNYKPGTYLSGWDSLQTELNPGLAIKRAIFSVWEEYQSFGLTAGMAHAADLPRALFLWAMSFVLPQNMIRYFYQMLMLFMGGLGVMGVLGGMGFSGMLAFLGALFYMVNLGTVQIFYLPYEAFSTFFTLLPWGIWGFVGVMRDLGDMRKRKKSLWLFFLINILGVPAFYTQQLFIVYLLVLGCVAMGMMREMGVMRAMKKVILAFLLILVINSFWLLPQLYFLKTNRQVVSEAKTNQLSTGNVFYQNYEKGTPGNFLKLEGFYFDLKGINNTFLFAPWKDHFASPIAGALPYVFAGLGVLGVLGGMRKKKNIGFILVYLLCATALLLSTPPFSWINEPLRRIMVINQIFRSPFTKFIIPYSLVYSIFVVIGIDMILKTLKGKVLNLLIYLFAYSFIFLYALPAFRGYFFSPEMKVKIPDDYQSVINYFKSVDKNSRVALSPDYTFWGWFFNKWGYNGSGFLWYGIEQPIVSRTFDVWSKSSESYFWEIKTAFEAEDIQKITNVFDKYQVDYLILDRSLIPVVSSYKALQYDRINNLLQRGSKITPIYEGKNISLYKIDHDYFSKDFIGLATNLNNIGPKINITNDDRAFEENGFFINKENAEPDIAYPFLDLTSQTDLKEKNWWINEDNNYFYLSTPLSINIDGFELFLNNLDQETIVIDGELVNVALKLEPTIKNNELTVRIEKKAIENFNTNVDQKTDFGFSDLNLSQRIGYLVKVRSINKGLPLFFYIVDETKKQSYLENRLDEETNYFVLPPRYQYGLGYTFAFQNKSFKNLVAANNLEELSLYLFPYQALKEMKFVRKGFNKLSASFSDNFEVKKINYFTYKIKYKSGGNDIILFQNFDPGWMAIANGKILPHIKVNNWANGWELKDESITNITIIFWPQYLEFFGFGLLIVAIILIIRSRAIDF